MVSASKEGLLRLNTKGHNRRCSSCELPYLRRNLAELWTTQEEGHRNGWQKDIAKICTKCMSEREAKKIMGIADVRFSRVKAAAKS